MFLILLKKKVDFWVIVFRNSINLIANIFWKCSHLVAFLFPCLSAKGEGTFEQVIEVSDCSCHITWSWYCFLMIKFIGLLMPVKYMNLKTLHFLAFWYKTWFGTWSPYWMYFSQYLTWFICDVEQSCAVPCMFDLSFTAASPAQTKPDINS